MNRLLALLLSCFLAASLQAQLVIKEKKYPSLLWEISGNGLKKPSYLIGTMHVSNKLAFNLPDSFYIAIKHAQVVALETNPETWQEDMDKYEFENASSYFSKYGNTGPSDYLTNSTLKFYPYYSKIEKALYTNSMAINSLLYRSYGNNTADFEEDTYLDMYIFQCGKKLGKRVAGVEDYGVSMKLMAEAYQDAAKDKNKKQRQYGEGTDDYSLERLQEAYRTGNLDLLDTINKFNSTSAAFDEKFLYRRNDLQAESIDSILKSGSTLFVGVGAAHLPGQRGVIEILRKKGYKLRPVKMGVRNSKEKEVIDKMRVPVKFTATTAQDGMYKVDIPGKLYKTSEDVSTDISQYADMANGSYYMVNRILTNASLWGHDEARVLAVVDSLLYENVPGKILSKTSIVKNNYSGFDIVNRTRRGDVQRSQIFVTPFEVIIFKMSGNGDYVKTGEEPAKFFNSISLKEFGKRKTEMPEQWIQYSPSTGGFSVMLPHEPALNNDGSSLFDAIDKNTKTGYRIIRTDLHNYEFVEEDTFDLALMEESFMASDFIDSTMRRKLGTHKGYPVLDGVYKGKNDDVFVTRFLIQGPHYYTLVAYGKHENAIKSNFFNSFAIAPFVYKAPALQTDTTLKFTVKTPVFPEEKKIKLEMPAYSGYGYGNDDEEDDYSTSGLFEEGGYKNKTISSDSTGEKIYISMFKWSPYYYDKDSSLFDDSKKVDVGGDSSWIVLLRKSEKLTDGTRTRETILTDTGSSRTLWGKTYYKDGVYYLLRTAYDTLSAPSPFLKNFFETFKIADTVRGINPFERKTKLFFEHLASSDTLIRKKAIKAIDEIDIDSTDFLSLVKAVNSLTWEQKNYLKIKSSLISRFSEIPTKAATDYLKQLYYAATDTVQLQYPILENLLQQKTNYSFAAFRDIVSTEPPVISVDDIYAGNNRNEYELNYTADNDKFFDELSDSLPLTKTILPDLLPLLNLEDYKTDMMELLKRMVDSNLILPKHYEMYYSKFLIEAKQELRKQAIAEKKKMIEEAEDSKKKKPQAAAIYSAYKDEDEGNEDLGLYATLLLPFADSKPAIMPFMEQLLQSNDKRVKYTTMILLLKNKRVVPDSLLHYFSSLDEYRYELFTDLIDLKKEELFPKKYKNHQSLAISKLKNSNENNKMDTVVFLERLPAVVKQKAGFVYFYKYKEDKDDLVWKIATVGLVPKDSTKIEFGATKLKLPPIYYRYYEDKADDDFTNFSDAVVKDDKPLQGQLQKHLKQLLFSTRKSAAKFYQTENNYNPYNFRDIR